MEAQNLTALLDITSRIDERLKDVQRASDANNQRIDRVLDRLSAIEIKTATAELTAAQHKRDIEQLAQSQANKWGRIGDAAIKIIVAIVAAFACFRLGLPSH